MIRVDQFIKEQLQAAGVSVSHGVPFSLPQDCVFEPPCSIKWMNVAFMLRLGAFSYAVSGYYFGAVIGRYTSIGENVSIGRGSHPVGWATTSPVFYAPLADVLDFSMPAADHYRGTAPYIPPLPTHIGSDVYIGHGAFIMQGIKIGNGAVIGAHAVVTRDVPDYAVVAGSPAVIRKMRFADHIVQRMREVAWWRYAFWDMPGLNVADPERFLDQVEIAIASGISEYSPKPVELGQFGTGV